LNQQTICFKKVYDLKNGLVIDQTVVNKLQNFKNDGIHRNAKDFPMF
jgi:hypothetical protein